MPAYQTGHNILVAYKPEATWNTAVTGASAFQFRPNPSQGLRLNRPIINTAEVRADGKTAMGRLGSKSVTGGYSADATVGTYDPLFEAVMRGTWTAAVAITQATMTSITTTSSTIVAAGGSWLTQGVRVGDVIRLTGHSTVGNNDRNLRVIAVTATTITVAEVLTTDAVADTSFTVTILKKLIQPTTPVRRSFTFEEYNIDVDLTERATGCRISSLRLTGGPDSMAVVEFGIVGGDQSGLTTGTSPNFTSPALTSTVALTLVDATIRFGGVDVVVLTGFELNLDMGAQGLPVIGSLVTPDVFENNTSITGSVTGARSDLTNLSRFTAETELELQVLLVEPESEPKDCISFFVPRIKLTAVDKSLGQDGAQIETMPFMVGTKGTATGYDDSMITIQTSAA